MKILLHCIARGIYLVINDNTFFISNDKMNKKDSNLHIALYKILAQSPIASMFAQQTLRYWDPG